MRDTKRYAELGDFWLSKDDRTSAFYICWYEPETRQRRSRSTRTGDLREAQKLLAEFSLNNGKAPRNEAPDEMTICEALLRYYNEHAQHIKSSVQQKIACRLWTDYYGSEPISALTPDRQDKFHKHLLGLGHSKSYADKTISTGRAALSHAVRNQRLAIAPFLKSYFTKEEFAAAKPKGRPMELEEIGMLLNAFPDNDDSRHMIRFILTMLNTMCRPDAALDLTGKELDHRRGYVQLNQSGRVQTKKFRPTVPMTDAFHLMTSKISGPIVSFKGKAVSSVKTAWQAGRDRAGLDKDVKPYSLRHTMSRALIERDVSRYQLSLMLGHMQPAEHESSVTSVIYAPLMVKECAQARAAIDDVMIELQAHTFHPLFVGPSPFKGTPDYI